MKEVLAKGCLRQAPRASGEGQGRGDRIIVATVTVGDSQASLQVTRWRRLGLADPRREL